MKTHPSRCYDQSIRAHFMAVDVGRAFVQPYRKGHGVRRRGLYFGAAIVYCAAVVACSTAPRADLALTQVPVTRTEDQGSGSIAAAYRITAGDELDIQVNDAPQYDQTTKVRPDGKITLNVVGSFDVAGRSPEQVQDEIRERYKALSGSDQAREYLIHANDGLEVKFPYYQQLNEEMKVQPDGKIRLQLVGTIRAEGLSPEELEHELEQRYAQFLKEPELTVIVRTATSQMVRTAAGARRGDLAGLQPIVMVRSFQEPQVFVGGEVARAGMIHYTPGLTLLQALTAAGGNLPSGDVTKLVVLRRATAATSNVLRPNLTKTFRTAPTHDIVLEPFDVVLLPPSKAQSVAEAMDKYVYKIIAPLKNSTFGYIYGATKVY
jgi:protein involved in polysaccharide export with SLBB domain